ncbi:MAG TPA: AbrB/MazE/SpoVT family DNA-binding domain-containing protein [Candidatus Gemmiger avistercoris]|uniref:AbrB/MazE/SpoVT family DNA-binding domain-containing protein n=1 Tax=Candidatus Gemmiger avistercoris TaxID=2838606 RepID=A0A9D2FKD2_9FIRM|nr:AbrB/MazE/SpoVT family DNA-binding domain-containing protein [uncultured Subdoligranulum sp.]HIZ62162.1 AbrB/MazE/SpoVT family DNA-binding domain-containing protein [Candidatus Gemmiger avistercoris]
MISTGIVRHMDSLGRVVLPKELRRTFGITADTPLEILTEGDAILLRKYRPADACALCGEVSPDSVELHGKFVCPRCRAALAGK